MKHRFWAHAISSLEQAGFKVTGASIPGLWNVEGLARDVTCNQLLELADELAGFRFMGAVPILRNVTP